MSRMSKHVNILFCLGFALLFLLPVGRAEGAGDNEPNLFDLAKKNFRPLTEAEKKLFRKVVNGQLADYSAETEEDNCPGKADKWGRERVLDANSIAWLCTDGKASAMVTHKGIEVKGARIDGELDLSYARISFPLHFEKSAFPDGIKLRYAEIRSLNLHGTHIGPINGDGLKVEDYIYLRYGFRAEGEVCLVAAKIGGNLECDGGQFINKDEIAISANSANIEGSVYLRKGFKSEGEVNLVGATISGDLDCTDGQFINIEATALYLSGANIKGGVFLCEGFKAKGEVYLSGTTIGGSFEWRDVNSPEEVELYLQSVRIGTLWDDEKSWPGEDKLFLNNFEYKEIDDKAPRTAESRIKWLQRQPGFWPQPYEQLAEVFRKSGQDEDAKKILIAKNEEKAKLTKLTRSEKIWYRLLGPMIGYGYRPLNSLWGVLVFVILGWILFGIGYLGGLITPESNSAYAEGDKGITIPGDKRKLSEVYPRFNFLIYSVDAFVPLIDLHQSKYWLPNANRGKEVFKIKGLHTGGLLRLYLWIHITMGWALSTMLVVGLTGLVRT